MSVIASSEAMIACAKRELEMRRRVYPAWVAKGKMSQEKADHEIAMMAAILALLQCEAKP